jgi:hypothetical protein
LDRNAATLLNHLAQRPTHRLGIYFEQLWHFFLQHDPETELIAQNLAVHHKGKTLGEFDCIYYCHRRGSHVHLELAVKYFLATPLAANNRAFSDWCDWLGPDNRDRLDLKLDQLLERQILLAENPVAKQQLADLGVTDPIKEIALKGYLFEPRDNPPPAPAAYNHDCPMNYWLEYDQIQSHSNELNADAFQILPKMRWLSRASGDRPGELVRAKQLVASVTSYFENDTYPLLIVAVNSDGLESRRFFLTPNHWPEHSR